MNEFKNFLSFNKYDVVGVCETKIDNNFKLKIPGFKIYTVNRNNRGGGVAIFIKESIEHSFYKPVLNSGNIEVVGVEIHSKSTSLFIFQVYKPPNKRLKKADLNALFSGQNIIVMGDLNCKRKEWNCETNNIDGSVLLDFCLAKKVTISTPLTCTNFPTIGRPNVLDFFLLKSNIEHSLPAAKCDLSSDHNPVEMIIGFNYSNVNVCEVFDFSKADWKKFKSILNNSLNLNFSVNSADIVESKTKEFSDKVFYAAKSSIPVKKPIFQGCLPYHLRAIIRIKNNMRRKYQRYLNPRDKVLYKKLELVIKTQLSKFQSTKFENAIKKLNLKDGSIWNYTKRFTKKTSPQPILFDKGDKTLSTAVEKADAFAKHFSNISNINNLGSKSFTQKVHRVVDNFLKQPLDINGIKFTNFTEVSNTIKSLKNNKAAGSDMISAKVLKNLPRKAIVFLIKLINGILCTGHFPSQWKIAKVIPLPKPGKDPARLTNYRPISLLTHLSKVVEKIVKSRILGFLQEQKILVNEQFGFREKHSTIDQLARLVNEITINFNKNKYTGALLLDIEKAFDTVWPYGLVYKLIILKFPMYLIFFIFSYVKDRKMFIFFENVISLIYNLLAGVPQGSVLGPILFLIFINDAPKIKGVDDSIFADDKLMFSSSFRISAIIKRLNQAYKANKRFFHKWKIKLNELKTEAILFTKRRPILDEFYIDNIRISWSDSVKYLGVFLDSKLNFTKHINYIITKAISGLIKLYPLFNRHSHIRPHIKLLLYKVLIRSGLTYACPVWSITCKSNVNKLQITQNKFLRLVGNYRKWSMISVIHSELNIEYIQDFIQKMTVKYFDRIDNHVNNLILDIKYDTSIKYKHKRIMHAL